ncbi:RILP-like protein homolog isoform X2 [Bradysia coprophila]|uniref:RILP-like protein homolog isoform X2 n=1 Tax=Bradysia coprophila TaxID=38358 RepID=UPI00187D8B0F|nr:RILP-like protein homolog isoform X2 [Bradysia coprophila]
MSDMVVTADEMSVVDVYDLASDIGKECEKIIDLFGADSLLKLMPKVINVLELLETIATRNESENTRLQELNDRIAHLECEKQEKAVFRQRFDKELELIEEQWRAETKELVTLVNNLQEENRRLQKSLGANTETIAANTNTATVAVKDDAASNANTSDLQTLQRFREQVEKHRKEMKMKDAELAEAEQSIQGLNIQMERLSNSSRESRKRQKLLQVQVRSLVEERADFLAQLQDQHREILSLRKRLGIAEKENEDLSKCQDEENDPHRARYSTAELKEILCERDELKSQINDLATELKTYKPVEELKIEEKPTEEDPPVQGPLPFEPDDAPWKKSSESGIRKFFRKLFSEPGTSSFPRRSLSTLSKMALSASPNTDTI